MADTPASNKGQASGRTRRLRRVQKHDVRDTLLEAAVSLFARHGYEGVSTGMVASAADISQPMVYYHFKSKDDLWQSAMDALMRELGRKYPLAWDELKDLDAVGQLRLLTRRFVRLSAGDPRLSQVVILESIARSERLDWLTRTYLAQGFAVFDVAIRRGIDEGRIKDLPIPIITNTLVAASSLTFCVAAQVKRVYGVDVRDPEGFEAISDSIVEILFNGLLSKT